MRSHNSAIKSIQIMENLKKKKMIIFFKDFKNLREKKAFKAINQNKWMKINNKIK